MPRILTLAILALFLSCELSLASELSCSLVTQDLNTLSFSNCKVVTNTLTLEALVTSKFGKKSNLNCIKCHDAHSTTFLQKFHAIKDTPCLQFSYVADGKSIPFYTQCFEPFTLTFFKAGNAEAVSHAITGWRAQSADITTTYSLAPMMMYTNNVASFWQAITNDYTGFAAVHNQTSTTQQYVGFRTLFSKFEKDLSAKTFKKYLTETESRFPVIRYFKNHDTETAVLTFTAKQFSELHKAIFRTLIPEVQHGQLSPQKQKLLTKLTALQPASLKHATTFEMFCAE